jgi:hypothetical protein
MFQEGLDRHILPSVHSRFSMGGFATPWDIRMGRLCRDMPRQRRAAPAQAEFPDVRLRHHLAPEASHGRPAGAREIALAGIDLVIDDLSDRFCGGCGPRMLRPGSLRNQQADRASAATAGPPIPFAGWLCAALRGCADRPARWHAAEAWSEKIAAIRPAVPTPTPQRRRRSFRGSEFG